MKKEKINLFKTRLSRLRDQGFTTQSNSELFEMAFGIRFTYQLCSTILILATVTQNIVLFSFMLCISALGIVLPNHPFDYIYNNVLSPILEKPKLPARARQLKFACVIATTWLATIVYMMVAGFTSISLVLEIILIGIALLTSTLDYCIPSAIYNILFKVNKRAKVFSPDIN